MNQPDACIVRITDAQGNTLGTGFLVSTDGRIATCFHVVEEKEPYIAFPGGEPRPAQVLATDPIHDVAILRFEGELPPGAEPAHLGRSAEGYYSDFRSRGYRPLGEMQGIPAEGRVLQAASVCPGVRHLPLILKSQDIRKGMSGAPVYIPDRHLVVGMITDYWDSLKHQRRFGGEPLFADRDTALATPSEAIAALCPEEIVLHAPEPYDGLTEGLRRLLTAYAVRIENFTAEYMGTPDHPVPFGGREAAIADLDSWVADPTAPPYLLLAAPAGRGKSALLVRWLQELQGRCDAPTVVFVPVSVRFNTNLASTVFAALAVRLAHVHGDDVVVENTISADMWRDMASEYLGRSLADVGPLLVVLDGVDEAADWEPGPDLFPAVPPPGLRVVLAARYRAGKIGATPWLRCLGWERPGLAHALDLEPLTPQGVADVLNKMGFPLDQLAQRMDIVTELHRLSMGDPPLVRLYIDDLWARCAEAVHLEPEDLSHIPSGLEGYFDRWWDDQRRLWGKDAPLKEPAVQAVLNLLACALGPLTRADVLALAGDCSLNTWTLEEALHSLTRLVIGDGDQHGYGLQHPQLGQYLCGRLTPGERQAWTKRFLMWGKQTLAALESKTLPLSEMPAYVIQHYATHLYAQRYVESICQDLYALVESQSWTAAKYVDTPWAGSLVQDLQLASEVAAEGNVVDWARAMGYQLRRALVEQLMSRISRKAILFLVRLGEVDRALDFARRQWDSFELLREIAQSMVETSPEKSLGILAQLGRVRESGSALAQCTARLAAAQEILRLLPSYRHIALGLIGETERLEPAISESELVKYRVLWKLPTLALSDGLSAAMAGLHILSPLHQAQTLRQISLALPQDHASKRNWLEQALSLLDALEQTSEVVSEKIKTIVTLLPFVGAGERTGLLDSLELAGDYLRSVEAPVRHTVTPYWAVGRIAAIDLDWSKRMLLESKWGSTPDVLYEVAKQIAQVDHEEALQIAKDRLSNYVLTPQLLVHIIGVVAAKDIEKAEALIREYAEQLREDKGDAHIAVAEACLIRGNSEKARETFFEHVALSDDEGVVHARADLQLAILRRSQDSVSVGDARDHLMIFPACPRCHESREKDAQVVLARMAVRQNRLDVLESFRFGTDAQLVAAYSLADYASPDTARGYLERQHIDTWTEDARRVVAHIAAVDAQRNPEKLQLLLDHFGDAGQPHLFWNYMLELPSVLQKLVEAGEMEPGQAKLVIEQLYPRLVNWECPRESPLPPVEFFQARCDCYDHCEASLVQLIGVMAVLDAKRSEEMVQDLPMQPVRFNALKQILYHTHPSEPLVHRIIAACEECIADPWQRAGSYYLLAMSLPSEMADTIKELIHLAEPLLSQSPTDYHTNKYGMRVRIGPSSTELSIRKAQALMKLVGGVSQLAQVRESLRLIDSLRQLEDKLRVLDLLAQQAIGWPDQDRLTLLRFIWEMATDEKLLDVDMLIAASVPILHSLGGEESVWSLWHYVEWAFHGLLPGGSLAARADPH